MLHRFDMEKNYQKYLRTVIIMAVLFKLLLMGLFSSDYQDHSFCGSFFVRGEPISGLL